MAPKKRRRPADLSELKQVDMSKLRKESAAHTLRKVRELRQQGLSDETIARRLNLNPKQIEDEEREIERSRSRTAQEAADLQLAQQAAVTAPSADLPVHAATAGGSPDSEKVQQPAPAIPSSFDAGKSVPTLQGKEEHPVLKKLKTHFGIEKLEPVEFEYVGFKWSFRPPNLRSYEWMSAKVLVVDGGVSLPSLATAEVCSSLAAIDDVPLFEVFDIDTSGRYIPDPLNPPPDIRDAAADACIAWFRDSAGLWEVVGNLNDKQTEISEKEREDNYPLYEEVLESRRKSLTRMAAGNDGEGASQD
jgi:hypothetical protein